VWSEVELAYRLLGDPLIIGITGTNGKTTTTELVGAMLRSGNVPVEVAGNVGRPLSELAGRIDPGTWIACELSSFQLEDIDRFRARIGVVLQVTPDHLDRHGTFEAYLAAKLRLFENQTPDDTAILNAEDPVLREAGVPGRGRRIWFNRDQSDRIDWEHSAIRGDHNLENALAAAAAAEAAGVSREARDRALRSFQPPPHRLQTVATRDGVVFVDDSKATNPEAAIKALTAYVDGVRLILGGSLKGSSFAPLAAAVAAGPVVSVDVYGEAGPLISQALSAERVPHRTHPNMAEAVTAAARGASAGDVVLLSPGCASFDEFRDYAQRGEVFARLAQEVPVGR
jgi:UDP-N-acetylmuramoylalanine--D-glutamate ligase